eukprot:15477556-Alexandrium_andersonii.AAC.1
MAPAAFAGGAPRGGLRRSASRGRGGGGVCGRCGDTCAGGAGRAGVGDSPGGAAVGDGLRFWRGGAAAAVWRRAAGAAGARGGVAAGCSAARRADLSGRRSQVDARAWRWRRW